MHQNHITRQTWCMVCTIRSKYWIMEYYNSIFCCFHLRRFIHQIPIISQNFGGSSWLWDVFWQTSFFNTLTLFNTLTHFNTSYSHILALRHIRSSLTTEASKTIAAAIVGSRLDYCNSLLVGTYVSNLSQLDSLFKIHLLWSIPKISLWPHYVSLLFVTDWISKLLQWLSKCCFSNSHFITLPLSHGICTRDYYDLLRLLSPRENAMAKSKSSSSVALGIWNKLSYHISSISALPAFRKKTKHHLFSFQSTLSDVTTSTNVNHSRCLLPHSWCVPAAWARKLV